MIAFALYAAGTQRISQKNNHKPHSSELMRSAQSAPRSVQKKKADSPNPRTKEIYLDKIVDILYKSTHNSVLHMTSIIERMIKMNVSDYTLRYKNYTIDLNVKSLAVTTHRIGGGVNFNANDNAIMDLSPDAFSLYMLICKLQGTKEWQLGYASLLKTTTLSAPCINIAVMELLFKGYLTPKIPKDTSDLIQSYNFWESPSTNIAAS